MHGDRQVEGINYDKTYALAVQWSTVCLLACLWRSLAVVLLGAENQTSGFWAFAQAELDEDIFLELPKGFVADHDNEQDGTYHVSHETQSASQSLYGLKQAALYWFQHLSEGLQPTSWWMMLIHVCSFTKDMIVLVYLDNCLFFGWKGWKENSRYGWFNDMDLNWPRKHQFMLFLELMNVKEARQQWKTIVVPMTPGLIKKILCTTGCLEWKSVHQQRLWQLATQQSAIGYEFKRIGGWNHGVMLHHFQCPPWLSNNPCRNIDVCSCSMWCMMYKDSSQPEAVYFKLAALEIVLGSAHEAFCYIAHVSLRKGRPCCN